MKKGSALLVVLGMVAFMVISAVAFSAYMRYSRLPSSYLLRTSSSRHLAKAALAEAIDMIDVSIGNNPHPGVGEKGYAYPRKHGHSVCRNYWFNHCFIGTNRLVDAQDTVSTLTMEGLAYLPPALINEARYFSRRSAAAVWKTLGFDSGRFAFSAPPAVPSVPAAPAAVPPAAAPAAPAAVPPAAPAAVPPAAPAAAPAAVPPAAVPPAAVPPAAVPAVVPPAAVVVVPPVVVVAAAGCCCAGASAVSSGIS